jgi:glycosyltransferase involved in cell wall biosynthesis
MNPADAQALKDPRVSLSVLVAVYNEQYLVGEALKRLKVLESDPNLSRIEIIVVDDGSTDRTGEAISSFRETLDARSEGTARAQWIFIRHTRNYGKGKAIQTALGHATGDVTVIYDADLEYRAEDISRLIKVFKENQADAVFGSRFAGGEVRRALLYRHQLANKFLTLLCNLVSNLNLTDVWTCYKAIRTRLLQSIPIVSNDFRIEPELTIKLAKREARIYEVPVSYLGRSYDEGKKIGVRDAILALWAILRFGFGDDIYRADEYGSQILARLARAPRFNAWMADTIRPFCGERLLEIGSGVGNLSRKLLPRTEYIASDINPLYMQTLANLGEGRPYLSPAYCDVSDLQTYPRCERGFDTVICLNVIEHVSDDLKSLLNIRSVLGEGGRAIVLVPQGEWNYGTLDEVLGHRRRYTRETLARLAHDCGMKIQHLIEFNRTGTIAWFLNGKLLKRRSFGLAQIWMLNLITPLMKAFDRFLPVPPLSLIAVMTPIREDRILM